MLTRRSFLVRTAALGVGAATVSLPRGTARAQESRTFTFGYDQPRETAYSFLADTFEKKLGELSGGKLKVRQFPGAAFSFQLFEARRIRVKGDERVQQVEGNVYCLPVAEAPGSGDKLIQ